MAEKYQIAMVGNKETILGFNALGLKTFNANSGEEAIKVLYKLKSEEIVIDEKTGETKPLYAIIFITEDLALKIPNEDYKKLSKDTLPALIPVPGSKGTTGYSMKRIGKMVEQAIGSDILGDK
jgi:V/A-type H+/Na+-transporting ATPase subunit F